MIEPARGALSCPVVLVRKKERAWRFYMDYRLLNEVTKADTYPLLPVGDSLNALSGNRYFSNFGLS